VASGNACTRNPLTLVLGACGSAKETTKIVIYTAKENEEIKEYLPVAKEPLFDLELEVLRFSTSALTARMLAEKGNFQAAAPTRVYCTDHPWNSSLD